MKTTALQISLLIGLVVLNLMVAVSANAQTQYRAHIPFDFTIGQKSYKAGSYFIDQLNTEATYKFVSLRDAKGRRSQLIMTRPNEDDLKVETASLAFSLYDSQYSLSVIRTPSFTVRLPESKAREALARNQNVQLNIVALTGKK
ncbi:MAG: hypothetical protein H0X08_03390 [Blastocatellia bacterium]|nr:hypothetical protein [Blastocatellia bacterium]